MAFAFASGDYIEQPASQHPSSISFWLRFTAATDNVGIIAKHDSVNSRNGFQVKTNVTGGTTTISVSGQNASGSVFAISGGVGDPMNNGNWHHVAVNFDYANGGQNQLFLDGVSKGTANSSAAWTTNSTLRLGRDNDTFWGAYVGELAEFARWGFKLTQDEVTALARGYNPLKVKNVPAPSTNGGYIPLIRTAQELISDLITLTVSGTSVVSHPRRIG